MSLLIRVQSVFIIQPTPVRNLAVREFTQHLTCECGQQRVLERAAGNINERF